jgi:hypothetical protein
MKSVAGGVMIFATTLPTFSEGIKLLCGVRRVCQHSGFGGVTKWNGSTKVVCLQMANPVWGGEAQSTCSARQQTSAKWSAVFTWLESGA